MSLNVITQTLFITLTKMLRRELLFMSGFLNRHNMSSEVTATSSTSKTKKLVVGLGNPGMNSTRHSVGMAVIAALAARLGVSDQWKSDRHVSGEVIVSVYQDTQVVLLRPKLLMNVNGVSVAKAARKFNIRPSTSFWYTMNLTNRSGRLASNTEGAQEVTMVSGPVLTVFILMLCHDYESVSAGPQETRPWTDMFWGRFSKEEEIILSSVVKQSVALLLAQITDQQPQLTPAGGMRAKQKRKEQKKRASLAVQEPEESPDRTDLKCQ